MEEKLRLLAEDAIKELEIDDCYVVEVLLKGSKVEIFLDSDEAVTIEKCKKISRKLEAILDESKELGETYSLDISSFGVGRPLLLPRQYSRNAGRLVEIHRISTEDKLKGRINSASDLSVTVDVEVTIKEGKKKKKVVEAIEILYQDIKKAVIKIEF